MIHDNCYLVSVSAPCLGRQVGLVWPLSSCEGYGAGSVSGAVDAVTRRATGGSG